MNLLSRMINLQASMLHFQKKLYIFLAQTFEIEIRQLKKNYPLGSPVGHPWFRAIKQKKYWNKKIMHNLDSINF